MFLIKVCHLSHFAGPRFQCLRTREPFSTLLCPQLPGSVCSRDCSAAPAPESNQQRLGCLCPDAASQRGQSCSSASLLQTHTVQLFSPGHRPALLSPCPHCH